ncbi:hypothetical protein [Dyella lutea]|uniref:SOUL heme-binding protein n=1 Tax=Dyella lutea TaxID=2950441 RepID=A0ABT1F5Q5_9GAMM|nr:hypothetical protein [Dyella lutea]MCP1372701.1 hypothetical protein [Dyella lutea]
MPFFRVMLHGEHVEVPAEDGSEPIVGFYVTFTVRAPHADAAVLQARAALMADWHPEGKWGAVNRADAPHVRAESVRPVGWFTAWRSPVRMGYVFYPAS